MAFNRITPGALRIVAAIAIPTRHFGVANRLVINQELT
jgi:hypothetical protein